MGEGASQECRMKLPWVQCVSRSQAPTAVFYCTATDGRKHSLTKMNPSCVITDTSSSEPQKRLAKGQKKFRSKDVKV